MKSHKKDQETILKSQNNMLWVFVFFVAKNRGVDSVHFENNCGTAGGSLQWLGQPEQATYQVFAMPVWDSQWKKNNLNLGKPERTQKSLKLDLWILPDKTSVLQGIREVRTAARCLWDDCDSEFGIR